MRALKKQNSKKNMRSANLPEKPFWEQASWPAKSLAIAVITLAMGYGLVAGGHVSNLGTEISKGARGAVEVAGLSIREISITGHKRASREEILKAAGFDVGTPIMGFKAVEARDRLHTLDWIETARIVRLLPDRVHIDVSERKPFALWQFEGKVSVIDKTGKRLKLLSVSDYPNFVQYVGKDAGKKAFDLHSKLNEFPELKKQVKVAIHVAQRRWTLKLNQNIDVYLPEKNIASALGDLYRLEERYHLSSKKIQLIDLRLPEKITLRLRDVGQNKDKATVKKSSGDA